ncbi:MAG: hypothetical protein ACYSYV_01080 [Planctomycetota bacterium]|jgi:cysteine synthase
MLTDNILGPTGNTPSLHLKGARILAEAEFLNSNPGGSMNNCVDLVTLKAAQRSAELKEDSMVVEPGGATRV